MSTIRARYGAEHSDVRAALAPRCALFVLPHERRDGFRASIRGHILGLADPDSGHALAPTPDDLFIVAIASELAWAARRNLRGSGMPDDVSVSADWRTNGDPTIISDLNLTVTVSPRAEGASDALAAALDETLAARSLVDPVACISWEGANR